MTTMWNIVVTYWDNSEVSWSTYTRRGFETLVSSALCDHKVKSINAVKPLSESPRVIEYNRRV